MRKSPFQFNGAKPRIRRDEHRIVGSAVAHAQLIHHLQKPLPVSPSAMVRHLEWANTAIKNSNLRPRDKSRLLAVLVRAGRKATGLRQIKSLLADGQLTPGKLLANLIVNSKDASTISLRSRAESYGSKIRVNIDWLGVHFWVPKELEPQPDELFVAGGKGIKANYFENGNIGGFYNTYIQMPRRSTAPFACNSSVAGAAYFDTSQGNWQVPCVCARVDNGWPGLNGWYWVAFDNFNAQCS